MKVTQKSRDNIRREACNRLSRSRNMVSMIRQRLSTITACVAALLIVSFADCSDGYLNTAPAGSYRPNAFGIYDMIGNLAEWVEDCSTPSYASMQSDGTTEGGDCDKRIVRGGSWGTQPRQLRSAERIRYSPTAVDDSIGIRVAKTLQ